jgi:ATP-binding cassette subfamily B protein
MRTLREGSAGRTTVLVTHRLRDAVDADRIVVFDAGRIAEQGRHDALLAHGGVYAALGERPRQEG